jgi:toxin ParE1/3/4
MKQYKVELLPAAWQDLDDISSYFVTKSVQAANRIIDMLFIAMRRLSSMPEAYPYVRDDELQKQGYRNLICEKYLCIYKIVGNNVYVYHVVHGARNYPLLFTDAQE